MDGLTFVVEMTKALAWPTVVLIVGTFAVYKWLKR